jgi:type IV pilus assembly protein PilC
MVSAGETTGNLDGTLENVSQFYDREVPKMLKKTFAVLEPAMVLVLAVIVLGAALAFFLALYKMIGSMGGQG